MFERLTAPYSDGSLVEVWVDRENHLARKIYKPGAITVSGKPTNYVSMEKIKYFFDNEIFWSLRLKSDMVVNIIDYGELPEKNGFFLLQEYTGPDLLNYKIDGSLYTRIPNIVSQIEKMFEFFQKNNVYKLNNSLSNLTVKDGIIQAFDFKYAKHRSNKYRKDEIHSIEAWISKIDSNLTSSLMKYI